LLCITRLYSLCPSILKLPSNDKSSPSELFDVAVVVVFSIPSSLIMGTDKAWIPFLLFSGLLDVLFFASAMSFLGMAMSPQESSMAGDTGGTTDSASGSDSRPRRLWRR
jgi:hypothetical protein